MDRTISLLLVVMSMITMILNFVVGQHIAGTIWATVTVVWTTVLVSQIRSGRC